jgi:BirA family biotin operon repressor/biotin-[acetyl-CoA-carboxylase] ligase
VSPSRGRGSSFDLPGLRRKIKPIRLYWFPRLRSTNDQAALLRKRGELFAPAIVLTGRQTAGRGRGANTWWSASGVLTVTFVLPIDERVGPHQVPLLAGLAVRNAAAALVPGADIQLKWPNDLIVRGRKLAGLLCERVQKADLIGVGMNVNVEAREAPALLRDRITSLSQLAGRRLDITSVLIRIAGDLHAMLTHQNEKTFSHLLRQYDEHHALIGKRVSVACAADEPPVRGKCEGLDAMGRLRLRNRLIVHRVIAGQVTIL